MLKMRRPSPAMGVALLALFIALGGTSYATVVAVAPNAVGTQQLKNDAVTRAKMAHESITSVLVKDGSLLATDFAPNQIPAGPAGPAGAQGPKGDKGDTGATGATGAAGRLQPLVLRSFTQVIPAGATWTVQLLCKDGEHAVSGGTSWGTDDTGLYTVALQPVYPDASGVAGYRGRGANATAQPEAFTVYTLCYAG